MLNYLIFLFLKQDILHNKQTENKIWFHKLCTGCDLTGQLQIWRENLFSSVQFSCSVVSDSLPPHESQHTRPPYPSPTPGVYSNSFVSIESVMPSSHLILCRPLLLLSPIPPSIRVFSNESTLRMRWPKYWSFIIK